MLNANVCTDDGESGATADAAAAAATVPADDAAVEDAGGDQLLFLKVRAQGV